jgi:Na+/glutamate symporter
MNITSVILRGMKQTTVAVGPSPTTGTTKPVAAGQQRDNLRSEFFVATANMGWQLAIVVLVPLFGGFELDHKLHTLPLLTISGFVVAMIGTGLVIRRQLQLFGIPKMDNKTSDTAHNKATNSKRQSA